MGANRLGGKQDYQIITNWGLFSLSYNKVIQQRSKPIGSDQYDNTR